MATPVNFIWESTRGGGEGITCHTAASFIFIACSQALTGAEARAGDEPASEVRPLAGWSVSAYAAAPRRAPGEGEG